MELRERLENSISFGEIFEITYYGGSNHGKPPNIYPIIKYKIIYPNNRFSDGIQTIT